MEYVKLGSVADATAPPSPVALKVATLPEGGIELTWDGDSDLESGIRQFLILRDGREVGRVPETPAGKFGRPLFQSVSYHDTPEKPLPSTRFLDPNPEPGVKHQYRVAAINGVGLESKPSERAANR